MTRLFGLILVMTSGVATAENPVLPPPDRTAPPPSIVAPDVLATLVAPSPIAYTPGDGATVSLLNSQSQLKLFANFSTIGVYSTTRPFPAGSPLFLLPEAPFGLRTNTFDLHARQTSLGASLTGPEIAGFTPGAFFLGFIQNDNLTSDAYGFMPFNAYGELKNDTWRFAAGLMSDVFNPLKPTVNSLIVLFTSGNTGSFRAQARGEFTLKPSAELQLQTQLSVSEPTSTIVTDNRRILEDNGFPNLEGRVAIGFGAVRELAGGRKQRLLEAGMSGLVGQLRTTRLVTAPATPTEPLRAIIKSWGVGTDVQIAVTDSFGLAGELFLGQGLGEYNGGVGQSFHPTTFRTLRARGGWGEVYYYFTDELHLHTGYGIDAPFRRDLAATQMAKNETYFANLVWDVSKSLQVSFEVNYRQTDYVTLRDANGFVFMTQFLWRF